MSLVPLLMGVIVAVGLHALVILTFMAPALAQWIAHPFARAVQPVAENPPPPPTTTPPPSAAKTSPSPPKSLAAIPKPAVAPPTSRLAHPIKKIPLPKDDIRFGVDHGDPTSIAWIGYDDYQQLMARKGVTEQPALQKDVEPLPGAPIRPDPTPPHPAIAARSGGGAPGASRQSPPPRPFLVATARTRRCWIRDRPSRSHFHRSNPRPHRRQRRMFSPARW